MNVDSSIVAAAAAVMGSLVGGLASLSSTWFTQRYQGRRDYLMRQIGRRESLYADFISEAARLYTTAFLAHLKEPQDMALLWGMVARIRLSSSADVIKEAENILRLVGDQFIAENLTPEQVHVLAIKADPLKAFGEAGRIELDALDVDR